AARHRSLSLTCSRPSSSSTTPHLVVLATDPAISLPVSITDDGTGATSASAALAAFGAAPPPLTQALGTAAASITCSSIPQAYSMLRLVVTGASATAAEIDRWAATVNGDSGSHYGYQVLSVCGTTPTAFGRNASRSWEAGPSGAGDMPGASAEDRPVALPG